MMQKSNCWLLPGNFVGCFIFFVFCTACSSSDSNGPPEVTRADVKDFASGTSQVSVQLADGFKLELWAPGPLVSNAVAISFDNQGVAYVAQTSRRKSSDIDIRAHRDWMTEDLGLQTLEDFREFHLRKLATDLSDQNTWLEDFNQDKIHDWRDLEIQTENVRRIWDSDRDGRADASNVFASGFNTMITGVAAGVLSFNDYVYLAVAPDLWRLEDGDGDGDADYRESISHGYGIHLAYAGHDMSGLTLGPDGKIYWSIGDRGIDVADKDGKRWFYPNQGVVCRANPDGSKFEVIAHGLRNTQELAFDAYGNLISIDNDGDHPGEHERFVHLLEGSDSGWRINWQYGKYDQPNDSYKVWLNERLHLPHFPGQAAYILPPLALAPDGPAGLAYNPGTALGGKWTDYFFVSSFTGSSARSKIQAFKLEPKGATFEVVDTVDVLAGIAATGVAFGPDGALYLNDWLDGWNKKPQGRIWRLDFDDPETQKQRAVTQEILGRGVASETIEELGSLIANPDMRVRMAAQFELVKRKEEASLLNLAVDHEDELARLHAIWGLGQMARMDQDRAALLLPLLEDPKPNVRAQTAKVLGDAAYEPAVNLLLDKLQDPSPRVQFFSVQALGKLRSNEAFQPLVARLEEVGDSDPHMRHAVAYALSKLDLEADLANLAGHPSKDVRIGAVVALRHQRSEQVGDFLNDEDPWVVTEAARAIHDDFSIPAALPALAEALRRTEIKEEAFIRRAINANLRLGDVINARQLAQYANDASAPAAMRADALWSLGCWPEPPVLDRVEGRHRVLPKRDPADAQQAVDAVIESLMAKDDEIVLTAAITSIGRLNYLKWEPDLHPLFKELDQPLAVRRAALKALIALKSSSAVEILHVALADQQQPLREDAQELMGTIELPEASVMEMLANVFRYGSIIEQQKAIGSLAGKRGAKVQDLLDSLIDQALQGSLPPSLVLDVMMAVENADFEGAKRKKAEYEGAKDPENLLSLFSETLHGGYEETGRQIFTSNPTAQCSRCHRLEGRGGDVGPPMDNVSANLSNEQLLISLIDPSARIAPGYGTVTLKLKDGRQVVGTLLEENEASLVIQEAAGDPTKIPQEQISERKNLPSSMFSMAKVLTKSEIRDLVAFLGTLK